MDAIVGKRIHSTLWDRRETQTQLGRTLGISQESVSKKLRGDRGWSLDEIMAICRHWGISPNELLGVDSNHQPCGYQPGEPATVIELSDHEPKPDRSGARQRRRATAARPRTRKLSVAREVS